MATCYDRYSNQYYNCRSTWNDWGRWVALAVIIVAFLIFFFLCSCLSARRRKKAGRTPYYGTGWVGATPFGHGQASYNPQYEQQTPQYNQTQQQQAPPTYNQGGYYGQSGGQNQGYFGGQQTDVEMNPPQNAYRAGDGVYAPPSGPPPAKK